MTKQVYIDISENFNNSFYSVLHWLSPPTLYLSPLPYVQGLCRLKYCSQRIGSLWVRRLCHLWKVYICCITLCPSSVKLVQNLFHFIKLWLSCQHMLHHSVDASYFTYNTFFSHVKARWDSNVQCIDIRIGRLNYDGWILFKFYINIMVEEKY